MRISLAAGAVIVALAASPDSREAQFHAVPLPSLPTGTGRITGVVTTLEGAPVAEATVTLGSHDHYSPNVPSSNYQERSTVSGRNGRFVFEEVPVIPVKLSARAHGFAEGVYGQAGAGFEGTPIQLNPGERLDAVLRLARGASIAGTVVDANGAPAAGFDVHAFGLVPINDEEKLAGAGGSTKTDENGRYRITDLRPGVYVLSAFRSREDGGPAPIQRVGDDAWAIESGAFHRNARSLETADQIELRAGEAKSSINMRIAMLPVTTVSGEVRSSDGTAVAGAEVRLLPAGRQPFLISNGTTDKDGTFQLARVTPGDYEVTAYSTSGLRTWGRTKFRSDGLKPASVSIELKPGGVVTGRIEFIGTTTPIWRRPVTLFFANRIRGMLDEVAGLDRASASPAFTYPSVPPGRYTIFPNQESLPRGWIVQSEMVDGVDALDHPFEIAGREARYALITVTDELSEVRGVVTGSGGRPSTGHTVVVFATDESYWRAHTRRIEAIRPDTKGAYRFAGLPAGDYVVALAGPEILGRPSSSLLKALKASGTRITLGSGTKVSINLKAPPALQ